MPFVAVGHYFAADVDEVVFDAEAIHHAGEEVGCISLGDGVEVELCIRVFALETVVVVIYGSVGSTEQVVEGGTVGFASLTEAEAPHLHKASDARVESTVGIFCDFNRFGE